MRRDIFNHRPFSLKFVLGKYNTFSFIISQYSPAFLSAVDRIAALWMHRERKPLRRTTTSMYYWMKALILTG